MAMSWASTLCQFRVVAGLAVSSEYLAGSGSVVPKLGAAASIVLDARTIGSTAMISCFNVLARLGLLLSYRRVNIILFSLALFLPPSLRIIMSPPTRKRRSSNTKIIEFARQCLFSNNYL